jgi:transcriptional regulator with XRE-family HTH domain
VSENLHRLTEEKGMSLAVVADRAGLDRREFFAVLTGEQEGDFDWLTKVAEAIGVDAADLVVDHRPPPTPQP